MVPQPGEHVFGLSQAGRSRAGGPLLRCEADPVFGHTGVQQQNVTGFHLDTEMRRHRVQFGRGDTPVGVGVQRFSHAVEIPNRVEQDPPAGDSPLGDFSDAEVRCADVDGLVGDPAVEAVLRMTDVPEAVDLGGGLEIERVQPVVTMVGDQRRRFQRALRGQEVQCAELVVRPEEVPRRPGRGIRAASQFLIPGNLRFALVHRRSTFSFSARPFSGHATRAAGTAGRRR